MKTISYSRGLIAIAVLGGLAMPTGVSAQVTPPPPPPPTIWNWFGIPQGTHRVRDARVNRRGNRPDAERTDPLKRIADPENLKSENPVIKKAAEIKADQDLAPQKIKAIKFLATVGCGCYPGVNKALLAALEDCTEEVRLEAAIALCQVAGNPCKRCENNGCCNKDVMNKLQQMAFGQDDKCCPTEASPQVREAAKNALNACKRMHPTIPEAPGPTPAGRGPERPLIPGTPPKVERPIPAPDAAIPAPPVEPTPPATVTPPAAPTPAPATELPAEPAPPARLNPNGALTPSTTATQTAPKTLPETLTPNDLNKAKERIKKLCAEITEPAITDAAPIARANAKTGPQQEKVVLRIVVPDRREAGEASVSSDQPVEPKSVIILKDVP